MLIHNNDGELVGELNTTITQDHTVINTNTVYKDGRPVVQNITVRDNQGSVRTTNVIGGRLLP
jgi:virulence-associated protein VapD